MPDVQPEQHRSFSTPSSPMSPLSPVVQVHLLGRFRVDVQGRTVTAEAWPRKTARQLFKCLLTQSHRRLLKDEAIELLWPDGDPATGSLTFAWDLDGSNTFTTPGQVITIVTSGRPGDLTVRLRVCDDANLCAISNATVHVVSAPGGGDMGGGGTGPPSASATPELDSVLLFGSGLSGLGAYALMRLRARGRRPR